MALVNSAISKASVVKAGMTDSLFQSKSQQSKYQRTNVKFTLGLPLSKHWYGVSELTSMQLCLTSPCPLENVT